MARSGPLRVVSQGTISKPKLTPSVQKGLKATPIQAAATKPNAVKQAIAAFQTGNPMAIAQTGAQIALAPALSGQVFGASSPVLPFLLKAAGLGR